MDAQVLLPGKALANEYLTVKKKDVIAGSHRTHFDQNTSTQSWKKCANTSGNTALITTSNSNGHHECVVQWAWGL